MSVAAGNGELGSALHAAWTPRSSGDADGGLAVRFHAS